MFWILYAESVAKKRPRTSEGMYFLIRANTAKVNNSTVPSYRKLPLALNFSTIQHLTSCKRWSLLARTYLALIRYHPFHLPYLFNVRPSVWSKLTNKYVNNCLYIAYLLVRLSSPENRNLTGDARKRVCFLIYMHVLNRQMVWCHISFSQAPLNADLSPQKTVLMLFIAEEQKANCRNLPDSQQIFLI